MKFVIKPIAFFLVIVICAIASAEMVPYKKQWDVKLQSLPSSEVLTKLDLDRPGLQAVKEAASDGDTSRALTELLRYYRDKYPPSPIEQKVTPQTIEAADRLCRHIFQWGPYQPVDYGTDIDWTINPADDIEWVAAVYRFYWATALEKAYSATHDDKYARAFVELTTDWIAKHPLDDWTRPHPTMTYWKGFAWLDIQTGPRAARAISAFTTMLHSKAVTPEFLAIFLASMYDHQRKTELVPMGMVHNKAIFEQRGVLDACHAFPEFADTQRWVKLALERTQENLLAQTTPEGVQREWCGSYHLAVTKDCIDIMEKASELGIKVSDDYRQRLHAMSDYLYAVVAPDLGFPMFGDTGRSTFKDARISKAYGPLLEFSELWKDPKYAARAKRDLNALPKQTSYAFESAGTYIMRSQWGTEGIYLTLHCAPPALSRHDHPDNGTFELYAHGRWLLTDSGYYSYGHDHQARAWHRQTRIHQTLTLDGKDAKIDGRLRLWQSSPELDALVVENPSYEGLLHRRSVWFVDKKFYVFLDEAIGKATGELCLHWTPAAGMGQMSADKATFTTQFPDANVLIHNAIPQHLKFAEEEGWFAWDYGKRIPRKMLSVKHPENAPAMFLTIVAPYRGTTPPEVEASLIDSTGVGSDEAQVLVRAFGKQWRIGRSLNMKSAWCKAIEKNHSINETRTHAK